MSKASPLTEADSKSISMLMSMDPLELTDENVDEITRILRAQRESWAQVEAKEKAEGKKPKVLKKVASQEDISQLMKDLGLGPK